jgi:hypothetical protein
MQGHPIGRLAGCMVSRRTFGKLQTRSETRERYMDRFRCTKCNEEFFLQNSGSCCAPPPGPHFCPDCGGLLHRIAAGYVCFPECDEE